MENTIVYDAVQDVKAVAEYNGGHKHPFRERLCEIGSERNGRSNTNF